ncbi:hypothetical protein EGCR1_14300 (plasmid) [Enterococcus gilvus]|uniref:hypothetical protein n=1 Tax=Enterococcus gilvus TaxID=160453 RepID=UPI000DF5EDF1|nr:hypothetical protein [Enterococcus gilvus]AXG39899.1 hypothetical protein EGCR1_14300 [Enterococcus gilvus]
MNLIKRWHLNTKKEKILVGIVVLAILFRLLIALEMPVKVYMQAGYDDALSINQALNILAGKWLGPYNAGILTKGLSFTFFLLVNHFSRLSYPLFLCLIDMLAAVTMVRASAPLIKNKYLSAFGFLFLIYSPATLASDFSLRIYRNSLVFAAVLFVLAGILGLYLRRKDTIHQRLPWSILLMAAFPFFWFLREDSIWLVPFYVVATVFTLLGILAGKGPLGGSPKEKIRTFWQSVKTTKKRKILGNFLLLIAPVLFTVGESLLISKMNEDHYGIFTTNDRTKTSFAKMTEHLIQIDNRGYDTPEIAEDSGIWVSKKTFAKAEEVSPTFAKYHQGIHWMLNDSIWPDSWPVKNGELPGDMFVWGLREMFQREGLYKDGRKNEKVFKKINRELEQGFKSGQLTKKNMLFVSKQSNGKKLEDLSKVANYMKAGIIETTLYKSYQTSYGGSIFVPEQPAEKVLDLVNVRSVSTIKKGMEAEAKRTRPIVRIVNGMIWIYRILSPLLMLISLGMFVLSTFTYAKKKQTRAVLSEYLIIVLGLLLTYIVYLFGVSWFATWAPKGKGLFMFFYTGAGVPLIQVLQLLGLSLVMRKAKGDLFIKKLD